jgi:hypothetical protein
MPPKKIFYFENYNDMPVKAGGILPYKIMNGELYFLMINKNNIYEDFGGKIENSDETPEDMASREACEESNCLLDKEIIKRNIIESSFNIYIKHAKYVLYIFQANRYVEKLHSTQFGDAELHDNIKRTVEWISYEQFLTSKKHVRLCDNNILFAMEIIKKRNSL